MLGPEPAPAGGPVSAVLALGPVREPGSDLHLRQLVREHLHLRRQWLLELRHAAVLTSPNASRSTASSASPAVVSESMKSLYLCPGRVALQ